MLTLTACASTTMRGGETSATAQTICQRIGESLPTRSRSDTPQTAEEIQALYLTFSAACPEFKHLIP